MGAFAFILVHLLTPASARDLAARGLDHFYNLEFPEALDAFREYRREDPDDPERQNLVAQTVLFNLMLRNGALESELVTGNNPFLRRPKMDPTPEESKEFNESIRKAVELSQARLDRNPRDTKALYAMSVAIALRGNYRFLVTKDWLDALRDITAARKLDNRITEIDPSNIDARLLQGVHDYVVGSLPWGYRILGFLAGFHGDRDEGIRTVRLVAEKGVRNATDAKIILCAIYRREHRPGDAVPIVLDLLKRYPRNYLFLLELSQMYADLGDKERALAALDRVAELKRSGAPGYRNLPPERIDFARGNLLFWYNDLDDAIVYLSKSAAKAHDLDPHSGVLSFLRLGQCFDLKGERKQAIEAYRKAIAFAPRSDAAGESRKYLSSPYKRPKQS
ncbi:MAG: tetratricopeptide repeat protein [Bryobacterales bacterium]|nr:tetratricopeptide repeat protein [Bryobacterales bacterium]